MNTQDVHNKRGGEERGKLHHDLVVY